MKNLSLVVCGVVAGCATSGTAMQAECESRHTKFPDIYRCTYDSVVKRNPAILQDARGKLYLLRGEQLAQDVDDGKMTSVDAKFAWQRLFVELKAAKDHEVLAAMDSVSRSLSASRVAPRPTVTCTSSKVGNSVDTTCR